MPVLLTPPQMGETAKGFLWWKKWTLTCRTRILSEDQAQGAGIALFRALAQERERRRRIESIMVTVIGSVESTFHAYESFRVEGESDEVTSAWLIKDVPFLDLTFETPAGDLIRSYTWDTEDGQRSLSTMSPMDEEQTEAARQRVTEGLRRMLGESD